MAPRWGNGAVDLLYLPTVLGVAVLSGLDVAGGRDGIRSGV